jgi:hypothetical protein
MLSQAPSDQPTGDFSGVPIELADEIAAIDPKRARAFLDWFVKTQKGGDVRWPMTAIQLSKARLTDSARRLLADALAAARSNRDPSASSRQLYAISQGFAEIHDYREARLIGDECANADDRLMADAWIVSAHARAVDKALADAWEERLAKNLWQF